MSSLARFSLIGLCVLILSCIAPSDSVFAQTADQIQQQIDQHNAAIKELDAEIAQYQKQLDTLGQQHQTLQTAIKSIDVSRAQTATQVQVTQNKIGATDLQLTQIRGDIATKQQLIDLDKKTVAEALRTMQDVSDTDIVTKFLAADNLTDAWTELDRTAAVTDALRNQVNILSGVKVQLANKELTASQTRDKLASLQKELISQQKALDANKAAKNALLTQTKSQESNYQSLIAQKKAEQSKFESEIYQLSQSLKPANTASAPSASKGILAWPLDHIVITQQFGRTADSGRLYASGTHDGVDFGAPQGTPIHAALSGVVQEINQGAVQNCQYGKWVLIKHPNGLSTLYAHLSQINVSKGQTVTTGDTIGFVGMTGYATGPHLHLTLYVSSSVTFKNYTCKSGPTVYIPIAPANGYLDPLAYL